MKVSQNGALHLILLTVLTMVAFAANSVLNRLALADGAIGPSGFASIRLVSGALALAFMVWVRNGASLSNNFGGITGPLSLVLYVIGFSFAYVTLDAGVGALILFGGVQITMFAGALLSSERLPLTRWLGAGVAFAGLVYLLWPGGAAAPEILGACLMTAAALGWGIYSLHGRKAKDPLAATAINFILAVPLGLLPLLVFPDVLPITLWGVALAILSGVVTSGLGYALWYTVLPRLDASIAAVAQLTVPIIALAGGMVFLGEALTLRFLIAAVLVLGGIAISIRR